MGKIIIHRQPEVAGGNPLLDERLSLKAKGAYAIIMLLKNSETEATEEAIAKHTSSSKSEIYEAIAELFLHEYIEVM